MTTGDRTAPPPASLGRAIQLHQAGRIAEAQQLFQRILLDDPRNLPALQHLAIIHANRGEFTGAHALFQRAAEVDPDSAEAHSNLGRVLSALGRHGDAVASFNRALALRPGMVEAEFNLGSLHYKLGQRPAAAVHLRRALAQRPDFCEAICLLAIVLQEQGGLQEARRLLSQAIAAAPRNALLHHALGRLLISEGDFGDAKASLDVTIRLNPSWAMPYYDLSQIHHFAASDPLIAAMERLLENQQALSLDGRVGLRLALYKALCDTGADEGAFSHLLAANAARRSTVTYDPGAAEERERSIRQVCSSSLIARHAGRGHSSRLPIFIVGFPRSGTTLLEQILSSHPAVHGAGEMTDIATMARQHEAGFAEANSSLFASLGAGYAQRLAQLAPSAARVVDKMPINYRHLGLIHLALPEAAIIHVRREAMDCCFSCFANDFGDRQPFSYDMAELGRRYRGYRTMMEHWRRVLPPGRLLEMDYEALVGDLAGEVRRVLDHCALPWEERCLEFHKTRRTVSTQSQTQVRRPLYASSIGRWRRFKAGLQPLADALADAAD
ncbi:MAG TPA: sulfotransferase [Dongiaceae bacterium]|jgi:tetratricopeptide (TPR) repeat protein